MRIAVLRQEVGDSAPADVADVLVQARAITEALRDAGHDATEHSVTLELDALDRLLQQMCPDLVFNLVEDLGGASRLSVMVPMLLEVRGVAFTGSSSLALRRADDKLASKALLVEHDLPTAPWRTVVGAWTPERPDGAAIIKAVFEHGSFGLESDSVVSLPEAGLHDELRRREAQHSTPFFAEAYVHGRELNVGVLETQEGLICLPPAEIDFSGFEADEPHVVGYRAKWQEDSREWACTPRRSNLGEADVGLVEEIRTLALRAFDCFGLSGYGRVDFRVDARGRPVILEVNANPCLAPDAGFAAAAAQAGWSYARLIAMIAGRGRRH